jgi:hypothetical protein
MTEDEERSSLEFVTNWHFNNENRLWRFVCLLEFGIESMDANLWLSDIYNHNFPVKEEL